MLQLTLMILGRMNHHSQDRTEGLICLPKMLSFQEFLSKPIHGFAATDSAEVE